MQQVDHIDWPAKLIYLHADTIVSGYDPVATYFEINVLVQINANNEQNYFAAMEALGNEPKGGGGFTPSYGYLYSGWRIVPSNASDHVLDLLGETISEDELSDRDVFDRSSLNNKVDIDKTYSPVEIRVVDVNGNNAELSDADKAWMIDVLEKNCGIEPSIHASINNQDNPIAIIESDSIALLTDNNLRGHLASNVKVAQHEKNIEGSICH